MTAKELKDTIRELQELYDDPKTDSDDKKIFAAGIEKAKKALKELEDKPTPKEAKAEEPKKAEKKEAKESKDDARAKAQSALDKCKELLKKHKEKKEADAKRVEKRRKAGKPAELTPAETVKKSAASVKAKVVDIKEKDDSLKKSEWKALASGILQTVESTLSGIEDVAERADFLMMLEVKIKKLQEKLHENRAERGMLVGKGPGVKERVLSWMNLNRDKLEHYTDTEFLLNLLEIINHFPHAVGIMRFGGKLPVIEFTVQYQGKRTKVLATSAQEAREKGAPRLGAPGAGDVSAVPSAYDIYADMFSYHPQEEMAMARGGKVGAIGYIVAYVLKHNDLPDTFMDRYTVFLTSEGQTKKDAKEFYDEMLEKDGDEEGYYLYSINLTNILESSDYSMARGGRTSAGIARDRMFRSDEPWEKEYKRIGTPKNPRYKRYDEGGETDESENAEMLMNQAQSLMHHSQELVSILSDDMEVDPWVITKAQRAVTDLADITHYLEGEQHKKKDKEYAHGGQTDLFDGKAMAEGGELTWHNAKVGDSAVVKAENKLGLIVHSYGRKFNLKFVDGSTKTYDASDLKFIRDDDFQTGGQLSEEGDEYGTFEIMKRGGKVEVSIVNEGEVFDADRYKGIFGDYDKDGVVNADDHDPLDERDKERVDSPGVSNPMLYLIDLKGRMDGNMYSFIDDLKEFAPDGSKIYARTKTPYSILNKLVTKRLLHPEAGLKDLIGTTIVTSDRRELESVRDKMDSGGMGEVIGFDDYYENPNNGYRAYHYNVRYKGLPVEVQVKTKRQKAINELSHEPYKQNRLDAAKLERMSRLADEADRGDKDAIRKFNEFMSQPNLEKVFYMADGGMMARGGKLVKNYRDELEGMTDQELAKEVSNEIGIDADSVMEYIDDDRDDLIDELVFRFKQNMRSRGEMADGGMMAKGGVMYPNLSDMPTNVVNEPTEKEKKRSVLEKNVPEIDIKLTKNEKLTNIQIRSSVEAERAFRRIWDVDSMNVRESMYVLYLNQANRIIGYSEHSIGGITGTVLDIQIVAATAAKSLAKGVIVSHNHPSGNLLPSSADIQISNQLKQALKLLNIQLVDSMILVPVKGYTSLVDEGRLAHGGMMARGGVSKRGKYLLKSEYGTYYSHTDPMTGIVWTTEKGYGLLMTEKEAESMKRDFEERGGDGYSIVPVDSDMQSREHGGMMARGGKTSFKTLSERIAANYEGKPVPPKYQDKYGKRYDKNEALKVGQATAAVIERRKGRM